MQPYLLVNGDLKIDFEHGGREVGMFIIPDDSHPAKSFHLSSFTIKTKSISPVNQQSSRVTTRPVQTPVAAARESKM